FVTGMRAAAVATASTAVSAGPTFTVAELSSFRLLSLSFRRQARLERAVAQRRQTLVEHSGPAVEHAAHVLPRRDISLRRLFAAPHVVDRSAYGARSTVLLSLRP